MDLATQRHPQGRVGPWVHARAAGLVDAFFDLVIDARCAGLKSFETFAATGAALVGLLVFTALAWISAGIGSALAAIDVAGAGITTGDLPSPLVELSGGIWESAAGWFGQHATGYGLTGTTTGLAWLILGGVLLLVGSPHMSATSRTALGAWIAWSVATTTIVVLGADQAPVLAGGAAALALAVLTVLRCGIAGAFHDLVARTNRRWQLRAQAPGAQRQANLDELRELLTLRDAATADDDVSPSQLDALSVRISLTLDRLLPDTTSERSADYLLQQVQEGRRLAGYRHLGLAAAYILVWALVGATGAAALVWIGVIAGIAVLASAAYSYDSEYREYRPRIERAETHLEGTEPWQPENPTMAHKWLDDIQQDAEQIQAQIAERPARYNDLASRLTSMNEQAERLGDWLDRHPQRPALGERVTNVATAVGLAGLATLAISAGGWWIAAGIIAALGAIGMVGVTIDPTLSSTPSTTTTKPSQKSRPTTPQLDEPPF